MTRALTLSTEMKVANASASLLLLLLVRPLTSNPKLFPFNQIRDQLQHHDHVIAFSTKRTVSRKDYLIMCCVSNLQREQAVRLPPVVWHSANTKPPATHVVFRHPFLFTVIDAKPTIGNGEQFVMFTDVCERKGTSSFFLTWNVPQEVSVFSA